MRVIDDGVGLMYPYCEQLAVSAKGAALSTGSLLVQAEEILRSSGGRMTSQRRLILETLDGMGGHPNAEQVCAAVHKVNSEVHPSTIYRTLSWLGTAGLVKAQYLEAAEGDRCEHYEPAAPQEHYHFVCSGCGKVIEFASKLAQLLRSQFAEQWGARVDQTTLTLYGLCAECLAGQRESGKSK